MAKVSYYNVATGLAEIIEIEYDATMPEPTPDELKIIKLKELSDSYASALVGTFVSSVTGVPVVYLYTKDAQFIYSKWANVLALNPDKDLVFFDIANREKIFMNRTQFLTLMDEMEQNEVNLYLDFKAKQDAIKNATTESEIISILI
jgi:hypothetical protein